MNRRFVIVVLLTLYLQPAAAANTAMDLPIPMLPIEQLYTDPIDGNFNCFDCALSLWSCVCALSQSSSSYLPALSNESSSYDSPPSNYYAAAAAVDSGEMLHYVDDSGQYLINEAVQRINENETTVQPVTVQAHVDDTYLPGYRHLSTSLADSQCSPHRRKAPRKDGYACGFEYCNKTFDRNCELNRHLKNHLGREERPHRCTVCNEGFLYPKDLTRHRRKHVKHAKVTFYCQVYGCNNTEGFSRRDNLLRHHRRQHEGVASSSA